MRTFRAWALVVAACSAAIACGSSSNPMCGDCLDAAPDVVPDGTVPPDAGHDAAADAPSDSASPDATPDAVPEAATDAMVDAPTDGGVDAIADAAADSDAPSDADDGACPGMAGPTPVRVGTFCVDRNEVTNAAYAQFLAADAAAVPAQPAPCAFNTSFIPGGGTWPPGAGKDGYPVVAVDWCDAWTFCAWAGKRLCGRIGGGSTPYAAFADASASQWFSACSGDGGRTYPYGNTYDNAACNGADYPGANVLRAAASLPTCIGGFASLFDMSGNVYEWEDACNANAGANDLCRVRGGGYFSFASSLRCDTDVAFARSSAGFGDIGFRCCSP